jgi:hypothetical protein
MTFDETYLLGYYPVMLYSGKVHVIPEALNKGILPPLILVNRSDASLHMKYMGSNMDYDQKKIYFSIPNMPIVKDVPPMDYNFVMTFDMIINELRQDSDLNDKRFNLIHFYLNKKTFYGVVENLTTVSIDLFLKNFGKVTENGSTYYTGDVELIIDYSQSGLTFGTKSFSYKIMQNYESGKDQLVNSDGVFYSNTSTHEMKMVKILSPQLFFLNVIPIKQNLIIFR